MERVKRFLDIPEIQWVNLLVTVLEAHNMAMVISKGDDLEYVKVMVATRNILIKIYEPVMDKELIHNLFRIFLYVFYNKLNNSKYDYVENPIYKKIEPEELFKLIKKYWYKY